MSLKKKTLKQRLRKNEMRQRQKVSKDVRKRVRTGRRQCNRFDDIESGSRPLQELVEEIAAGSAAPTREVALDPRSLTDLLLQTSASLSNTNSGGKTAAKPNVGRGNSESDGKPRLVLPEAPLPEDHPLALPEVQLGEDELGGGKDTNSVPGGKNQYRHHGDPYVFWERVGLHPLLLKALRTMRFTHPTPVQEEVLPSVLSQNVDGRAVGGKEKITPGKGKSGGRGWEKDVIISAETGSGKTLAFAIPILQHVLTNVLVNEVTQGPDGKIGNEETANAAKGKEGKGKKTKGGGKSTERGKSESFKKSRKRLREGEEEGEQLTTAPPTTTFKLQGRLMQALIVSPTRELALQISEAMQQLVQHAPQVIVGCVVGGMAPEKQQRVLNRHPHVLICTPGRLWELMQKNEGCYLGHSLSRRLSYVVLDEADKLLQSGRFEELKNLLERIHCEILPAGYVQEREEGAEAGDAELEAGFWDAEKQKFVPFPKDSPTGDDDKKETPQLRTSRKDEPRLIPMPPDPPEGHRVTTFVTSATLSLQTNYVRRDMRAKKTVIRTSNEDTMGKVLQQLEIKPSNAHVFTISPKVDVAAKIHETYLRCPGDSKDLYLYYFLKMYRERSIVFVNAISMLRRLVKLLEVLGIPVAGLHASLQQRQRLKFIDKFRKGEKRVLVATDIASRGLDVEGVRYVVHFQVPRSTDAYIHRCGRTARCGGTGLSLLMVNAQEHVSFTKLMGSLGRSTGDLEVFALQPTIVHQLHAHLKVALQIDKLQKEIDKSRANNNWARRMSREADVDVDDLIDDDADTENKAKEKAIKILRRRLMLLGEKDMGTSGGKGSFRSSAQAIGAKQAESKLVERAQLQVTQKPKKGSKVVKKAGARKNTEKE
ncbi:ATP-dependent DEAD/H RNA helicase, putative [Trypanosoma equiperdum]|uniref:ATP-dependent RNA helicase n=2 Tax=Trypanozoon TaxID=39700 RepID=Q389Z8_TRYB2|nr:ATP-dependent DEAD/H RNA helicase, putative [Trypanosoma brucei brucei TREU927]EAN78372.1 ATP-dependent DEAD/H RNA helicase, putative [Trypanosoma brucei brucei TREU927]SCU67148.1 ATP-dependent DEAD/H RNA helicase, putative [Trypanosoma equiperdum]